MAYVNFLESARQSFVRWQVENLRRRSEEAAARVAELVAERRALRDVAGLDRWDNEPPPHRGAAAALASASLDSDAVRSGDTPAGLASSPVSPGASGLANFRGSPRGHERPAERAERLERSDVASPAAEASATAAVDDAAGSLPYLIHRNKSSTDLAAGLGRLHLDPTTAAITERVERYGIARKRAEGMAAWMLANASELVDPVGDCDAVGLATDTGRAVERCGQVLLFRDYTEALGTVEARLFAAHFCGRHLVCPLCGLRRTAKTLRVYTARVLEAWVAKGGVLCLGTLTVKDGPDLAERFEHLRGGVKRLHDNRRRWLSSAAGRSKKAQRWTELGKCSGGMFAFEVKRGRGSGAWHPHMHAVWLCHDLPDAQALSAEWKAITGDSFIVDVRPFHCMADADGLRALTERDGMAALQLVADDLAEVIKYPLKLAGMPYQDNWHAFRTLRGRRCLGSFGDFYGVEVGPELTDAPLTVDDIPFVEIVARYVPGEGRYELSGDTTRPPASLDVSPVEVMSC